MNKVSLLRNDNLFPCYFSSLCSILSLPVYSWYMFMRVFVCHETEARGTQRENFRKIVETSFSASLGLFQSPGGGVLGSIFAGYVPLSSPKPYPNIVYFEANYRPHVSHFWANIPQIPNCRVYLPLKSRKCATHSSNSVRSY